MAKDIRPSNRIGTTVTLKYSQSSNFLDKSFSSCDTTAGEKLLAELLELFLDASEASVTDPLLAKIDPPLGVAINQLNFFVNYLYKKKPK